MRPVHYLVVGLAALCLFQLGLGAGWWLVWRDRDVAERAAACRGVSWPPAERDVPPTQERDPIDVLLQRGRYDLALTRLQSPKRDLHGPDRPDTPLRTAFCLENLGRWDEAAAAYRALAAEPDPPGLAVLAELGLARVWIRRGQPDQARPLLGRLLFRNAAIGSHVPSAPAEVRYLLGFALAHDPATPETVEPLRLSALSHRPRHWHANAAAGMNLAAATRLPGSPTPPVDRLSVRRWGDGPEQIYIAAWLQQVPVTDLLAQVADRAGLKLSWAPTARLRCEDRTLCVRIEEMDLGEFLQGLAVLFGIVWRVQGDELLLTDAEEGETDERLRWQRLAAKRMLLAAVMQHPEHHLAASAYQMLGNLTAAGNDLEEAAAWYERAAREAPRSATALEANFNLGLLRQRMGLEEQARAAWFRVIDQAPEDELALGALVHVGLSHLRQGKPHSALGPLRRAVGASLNTPVQPGAVLALSAAYLVQGEPQSAHGVLYAHRHLFQQEPYLAPAAFLDALARFRVAGGKPTLPVAKDLLAATLNLSGKNILGPVGVLLVGHAYRELGLNDAMARQFQQALPQLRGAIAEEMAYYLADAWYLDGKRTESIKLLVALATTEGGVWRSQAQLRLAEIALGEQRPEEAIYWSRAAAEAASPLHIRKNSLLISGNAYLSMGKTFESISCFQGVLPEEVAVPLPSRYIPAAQP